MFLVVIFDMFEMVKYVLNYRVIELWRFIYVFSEIGKINLINIFVVFFKKFKLDMIEEKF